MGTKTAKKQFLMKNDIVKVLLVEDDAIDRKLIEHILASRSRPVKFVIDTVTSISEAIEHLGDGKHNIVLLDLMLPDSYRVEAVEMVSKIKPHMPIVVLTELDDEQSGLSAIEKGATDYLIKDQSLDSVLVQTILHALTHKRESEEWWGIFDAVSDLIFVQDKNFTITKANKAFVEAMKSKPEDIIGKKCYEIVHKRSSPWPECPFAKTIKDKQCHSAEIYDENIGVPPLFTVSPIFDDDGNLTGSVHVIKDMSDVKKIEKDLHTMVKQNADGILIIDRKGIIRFVNDAAESLFDRKSKKLIGESFGFIVVKDKTADIEIIQKRGEIVTAEMRVVEITWEGEMVHLASLRNVTERKRAEEKLKETIKMKSEFISLVSHELRTPLTAIKGGIALVVDGLAGEINREQKELLDISKKNVDRLSRLINEVLDFHKIESCKMTFNMKLNDISTIAKDVYETMAPIAADISIDFLLKLNNNLPKAKFDSDKITQVLTNLVDNAMKFTEKGHVTIKTGKRNGKIYVSVSDTGGGIKKEDLPRVFDRFEQLATGGERKTGGTGLGLTISKEIIEQHNGTIWIESEFGKGAKFTFTLPISKGL